MTSFREALKARIAAGSYPYSTASAATAKALLADVELLLAQLERAEAAVNGLSVRFYGECRCSAPDGDNGIDSCMYCRASTELDEVLASLRAVLDAEEK